MPKKAKQMNDLINIDDDMIKVNKDEKKVKQTIFEGKDNKKPKPKKKYSNK